MQKPKSTPRSRIGLPARFLVPMILIACSLCLDCRPSSRNDEPQLPLVVEKSHEILLLNKGEIFTVTWDDGAAVVHRGRLIELQRIERAVQLGELVPRKD